MGEDRPLLISIAQAGKAFDSVVGLSLICYVA